MVDKGEFVDHIQKLRAVLATDSNIKCSCPTVKCEWHGDCYNCVRIHRHAGDVIPKCLQFVLKDVAKKIARAVESTVETEEQEPSEYWDYLKENYPAEEKKY